MTIEAAILKNVEKLPETVKQAVLLYTEFLASQYGKEIIQELSVPTQKRRSGILKGTFVLPLPKEFHMPMELLDAEQKAALEKKYGYGGLAGKIKMSDDFDEPLEDLKDYM